MLVAPWDAILAKVGGVFPVVVRVLVFAGRLLIGVEDLARLLALFSICLAAVSRCATCEAMIEEAACSLPFSVYSLKISKRSKSFDCSSRDLVRV